VKETRQERYKAAADAVRTLRGLTDHRAVVNHGDGREDVWAPAKPLEGPRKWRNRLRRAWLCITGEAEAVRWF